MQPSAQWHHAQDAIPPAIPPRSRAVQRTVRMPCLREFHACLAGTLLRGPYTSPYSLWAVKLGLFYHINNVIMRKPGLGKVRPLAPALEKLLGARSIVACGFQGDRLTRQAPCRRVSLEALSCHPERSEGSAVPGTEILRCAQDDRPALRMTGLGGRSNQDGRPALSGFTHRANKERAPKVAQGLDEYGILTYAVWCIVAQSRLSIESCAIQNMCRARETRLIESALELRKTHGDE